MMRRYYLLAGIAVACVSVAITWWHLVDPLHPQPPVENASNTTPDDFVSYMFSLQWPPSTCTSQSPRGLDCGGVIPGMFTIHGLWPQDKDDNGIPPYAQNPNCTPKPPTDANKLPTILKPIEGELKQQWPDLKNPEDMTLNQAFWRHEWDAHGKCSKYPNDPLSYFQKALELKNGLAAAKDFFGLEAGKSYTVRDVENAVKNGVGGKQPQIACSINKDNPAKSQLYEIRLCYDKGTLNMRDCKKSRSQCPDWTEYIDFPKPLRLNHLAATI